MQSVGEVTGADPGQPVTRHALIRVDPGAWPEVLAGAGLRDDALLAGWAMRGWPLVARRRAAGDPAHAVPVGVPLPPTHGKRRVALALPVAAVRAVEPPATLRSIGAGGPPAWGGTLTAIGALAARHGVEPRVFGSFAWAALTGLAYVMPTSDLDLLWPAPPDAASLLDALDAIDAAAPGRVDGEVVRDGAGAQWRELRAGLRGGGAVLVKTLDGVSLRDARAFLRPAS